ncbi:MAG: protein-L-isoaspartate(D-aspartate) O-methyltransferase [Alphaproteobacteria bacterium]
MNVTTDQLFANAKIRMILTLRKAGITDTATLRALEEVPRELFAPEVLRDQAYENRTLPIDCGQTLSAPDVVGLMTQSLAIKPHMRVLEIGTGSGYQAAILGKLAARVFTIERWKALSLTAVKRIHKLNLPNVLCAHGDGYLGWPAEAPFDGILIAAGCEKVPDALFSQLTDGGRLIAPVGLRGSQSLVLYQRQGSQLVSQCLAPAAFVPLLSGTEDINHA